MSSPSAIQSPASRISETGLSRAERLRGRKTFRLLFHLARRWELEGLRLYGVYFAINLDGFPLKVAFSVPKKVARKAVQRNRARRRLREAFRLLKPAFLGGLSKGEAWLLWQWYRSDIPSVPALQSQMQKLYKLFLRECSASSS